MRKEEFFIMVSVKFKKNKYSKYKKNWKKLTFEVSTWVKNEKLDFFFIKCVLAP